jgi:drug/metabolite transporter (DMT)-like permease
LSDPDDFDRPARAQTSRALILLVASSALFGLMAFLAKLATARIDGAQVAMIRFAVSLVPIAFSPAFRRAAFTFKRADILFIRGVFGGLAVLLYFLAIERIPVGVATLLNYTSPVFGGLFAAAFIGERIRGRVAIPLAIALAGVFLVVHAHAAPTEILGFGRWELAGLGSAVCSGAALTAIRVARRTEGSWSIFASLSLFGLLSTAPFALRTWTTPTAIDWLLMIGVGLVSIVAQILMTHAYRWVETMVAGAMSQIGVIVSMALGALFLGEAVTALTVAGTALTIGGVTLVVRATTPPRASPEEILES